MIFLDIARGEGFRVRDAAVYLTMILCRRLSLETLRDNAADLFGGLFPVIESEYPHEKEMDQSIRDLQQHLVSYDEVFRASISFACYSHCENNLSYIYESFTQPPAAVTEAVNSAINGDDDVRLNRLLRLQPSPIFWYLCETGYVIKQSRLSGSTCSRAAVSFIKGMLVGRLKSYSAVETLITWLPDKERLNEAKAAHLRKFKALGLNDKLAVFLRAMRHNSAQVRKNALKTMSSLLRAERKSIYSLALSRVGGGCGQLSGKAVNDDIVLKLLRELLALAGKEQDTTVLIQCARCIGELGAIDCGNLPLLGVTSRVNDRDVITDFQFTKPAPWEIDITLFGLDLMQHQLIPTLREGVGLQDRTGYAIQEVLIHLADRMTGPGEAVGDTSSSNSSSGATGGGTSAAYATESQSDHPAMPPKLRDALLTRTIMEVTEPFWTSK